MALDIPLPPPTQFQVAWFNQELACVVMERAGHFVVATVYEGDLAIGDELVGSPSVVGPCQMVVQRNDTAAWLNIEGIGLSESDVSDLLVHLRD